MVHFAAPWLPGFPVQGRACHQHITPAAQDNAQGKKATVDRARHPHLFQTERGGLGAASQGPVANRQPPRSLGNDISKNWRFSFVYDVLCLPLYSSDYIVYNETSPQKGRDFHSPAAQAGTWDPAGRPSRAAGH